MNTQHTNAPAIPPRPIATKRRKIIVAAALAAVGLVGEVNAQTSVVGAPPVLTHRVALPVVVE